MTLEQTAQELAEEAQRLDDLLNERVNDLAAAVRQLRALREKLQRTLADVSTIESRYRDQLVSLTKQQEQ